MVDGQSVTFWQAELDRLERRTGKARYHLAQAYLLAGDIEAAVTNYNAALLLLADVEDGQARLQELLEHIRSAEQIVQAMGDDSPKMTAEEACKRLQNHLMALDPASEPAVKIVYRDGEDWEIECFYSGNKSLKLLTLRFTFSNDRFPFFYELTEPYSQTHRRRATFSDCLKTVTQLHDE